MFLSLRSPWTWAVLLGLVVVVAVVFLLATSGGDDEEEAAIGEIERGPDKPIEIDPGERIVIGVSTALTGPIGERGAEYRDAYLTAFAALGYRYILWRELKIVRRQLTDTKTEVLRVFSVTMPTEPPSERRILLVERPEWLHSVGVQFGRHFVFLPWLSTAPGLYERLADESGRNQGVEVAGRPGPFPTTPRLALDFL